MNDSLSEQICSTPEGLLIWNQERAKFEVTERICELMAEQGIKKKELAKRLGVTKGYVSQVLGGSTNLTINSIVAIYFALGRVIDIKDHVWRGPNDIN